jgi:hypothetical protein
MQILQYLGYNTRELVGLGLIKFPGLLEIKE